MSALAGVYTFHHDPGELSAAFVWQRIQRLALTPRPPVRFIVGGWTRMVEALERRARDLGVQIVIGGARRRAARLSGRSWPWSCATPARCSTTRPCAGRAAARYAWTSACTRGAAIRGSCLISRMPGSSSATPRRTPRWRRPGSSSIQAQMPIRPSGERGRCGAATGAVARCVPRGVWRERVTWRRRQVMDGRSGALDLPGSDVARSPGDRPWRGRLPMRRPGRGRRLPGRGGVRQRDTGAVPTAAEYTRAAHPASAPPEVAG